MKMAVSVETPAIYIVRKISWLRISHESMLYIDSTQFFEFLYRKPLISIISCILRKVIYLGRNSGNSVQLERLKCSGRA